MKVEKSELIIVMFDIVGSKGPFTVVDDVRLVQACQVGSDWHRQSEDAGVILTQRGGLHLTASGTAARKR